MLAGVSGGRSGLIPGAHRRGQKTMAAREWGPIAAMLAEGESARRCNATGLRLLYLKPRAGPQAGGPGPGDRLPIEANGLAVACGHPQRRHPQRRAGRQKLKNPPQYPESPPPESLSVLAGRQAASACSAPLTP